MSKFFGFCEECYECRLNKYIYNVDLEGEEKEAFIKKQEEVVANADPNLTSREFAKLLSIEYNKVVKPKDYTEIKHYFNQKILSLVDSLQKRIDESANPFLTALQLAIVGNYIDYDALKTVEEDKLESLIDEADDKIVDKKTYDRLLSDLSKASKLVYLTDNCGEVVLDKLFIKQIHKDYPSLEITAMVRGDGDAINDANMKDAEEIKLNEVCNVVDNGLEGIKTIIANMPEDRKKLLNEADVLIAKGQANAESLQGCGLNMYYIFLCKCEKFANEYNAKKFDAIISRDKKAK